GELVQLDNLDTSIRSRVVAQDVEVDGEVVLAAGTEIGDIAIRTLVNAQVEKVRIRSVLTCESRVGTCAVCYGQSLATGKLVDIGEAVGIIAAQSIGGPGTQLTMRTFQTGGVVTRAERTQ